MDLWGNRYIKLLGFVLAAIATFSVFGVYSSGGSSTFARIVVWTITISTGTAISLVVTPRILEGRLKNAHSAIQVTALALIMSLPITIIIVLIKAGGDVYLPSPLSLGRQFILVFFVSLLLSTIGLPYWKQWFGKPTETSNTPGLARSFRNRLSQKYQQAELIAVSAEDHYVRVHTMIGDELILMRFSDALLELEPENGMQVHRSWWVSFASVVGKRQENRRLILQLTAGVEAPVARSFRKEVLNRTFS